jgi:glucokinase
MNTLAIDIGGTNFRVALFDGERIIQREGEATDRAGGPTWMVARILAIVRAWNLPIARCGISFGGPVIFAEQRVALSTHVGGWNDFPLVATIRDGLGASVIMDNDANVGALGEGQYGAGKGMDPLFYMTLSTGIGGGILTRGQILRGADSWAGEIGHLTIRPSGPECLCGARGCFERMCSGLWLERDNARKPEELLQDPAFVASYVENLALGLKAAIMLLNPARIVIGGGLTRAGDALFVPLRAELRRRITDWSRARIDVVPAALGDDSGLYGALALARMEGNDREFPKI